jgi:hypothetical protein
MKAIVMKLSSLPLAATAVLSLLAATSAHAATPTCNSTANENKVSWPDATNPVWEFCWLRASQSSGPRGSGLELRNVHYRGVLMIKRVHSPNLFAEYRGVSTCYRDWKDVNTAFAAEVGVRNVLGTPTLTAKTNCDVSSAATTSYGACPFNGSGVTVPACAPPGTVAIENLPNGDGLRLTQQYEADWYKYAGRYVLYANGNIDAELGFGNSNGTNNNLTHWHHNYFRFDFDIDGANNDVITVGTQPQTVEFAIERNATDAIKVTDAAGGFGYQLNPGALDNLFPANQSGRNLHTKDILGTAYLPNEFTDNSTYSLSDCAMNNNALANGGNIDKTDVVVYYRASVRDSTANNWSDGAGGFVPQDSMVCKKAGPQLQLVGNFPIPAGDFSVFKDGME